MTVPAPGRPGLRSTRETWAIQGFHESGQWRTYEMYARMPDLTEALRLAQKWGDEPHFSPLGIRVIDRHGWTSEVFGGRQCFELTYNPLTEKWTGRCTVSGESVSDPKPYRASAFGKEHVCAPSANSSINNISGGFSHAGAAPHL